MSWKNILIIIILLSQFAYNFYGWTCYKNCTFGSVPKWPPFIRSCNYSSCLPVLCISQQAPLIAVQIIWKSKVWDYQNVFPFLPGNHLPTRRTETQEGQFSHDNI